MDESIGIIIIGILLFFVVAEFFGRSKHIGRWWTFFLLIGGLIPGVIALLVSPSAKSSPTKANSSFKIWAVTCFILGILNLIGIGVSKGQYGHFFFVFIILGFYLFNLSEGLIINKDPKYYFSISPNKALNDGITSNTKQKHNLTTSEQKQSIEILKEKGLLNESEYKEKIDIIEKQIKIDKIYKSKEYLYLKNLFESGLFTKDEFESKVELLKTNASENNSLNQSDIVREKLIGTWKDNVGTIEFWDDNTFVFNDKNKDVTNGSWSIDNSDIIEIRFKSRLEEFYILELSEETFSYEHNNSRFTLKKEN